MAQHGFLPKESAPERPQQKLSSSFLAPPADGLNRSTGSSPDSCIDPYMTLSSAAHPPYAPNTVPPRAPVLSADEFPSTATHPPANFGLDGRPLPSAPPTAPDPLGLRQQRLISPDLAPARDERRKSRLGSLKSLTLPFGRAGQMEDVTTSSFTSDGSFGANGGYWDTSLGLLPPPSPSSPSNRSVPVSAPSRATPASAGLPLAPPSPAAINLSRPSHTIVDLPTSSRPLSLVCPLPPLPTSTSFPVPSNSPHVSIPVSPSLPAPLPAATSLAARHSIAHPPSALTLPLPPSPEYFNAKSLSSRSPSPASTTSSDHPARNGIKTISPSTDGFYRVPLPPPPSLALTPTSTMSASFPAPPSSAFPPLPHSAFSTTPFPQPPPLSSTSTIYSDFPLPPLLSAPLSATSPASSLHPLNPFGRHAREWTGGSSTSGGGEGTGGGWSDVGTRSRAGTAISTSGTGKVPSFVSVFVPPSPPPPHLSAAGSGGWPFGLGNEEEDEESSDEGGTDERVAGDGGEGFKIPIYPPQSRPPATSRRFSHRPGMDSVSSSVAARPPFPAGRVRHRFASLPTATAVAEEPVTGNGGSEEEEKKRRTERWLKGVSPSTSQTPAPSVSAPSLDARSETATTGTKTGTGTGKSLRWAGTATMGWSIRDESERRSRTTRRRKGVAGWWARRSKRVKVFLVTALVVLLLLLVGLAIGLSKSSGAAVTTDGDCTCENGGTSSRTGKDGTCACACRGEWGGQWCHLNATCVDGLAHGLREVAETATGLWAPEVNLTRLSTVFERHILPPSSSSASATPTCASQLSLLALPSLSIRTYPTRLSWTQAALLHTLSLTESNNSLTSLRTFASGLSFISYGDEPATKPNSNYQAIVGGFTWDLAVMTRGVQDLGGSGWEKMSGASAGARAVAEAVGEPKAALEKVTSYAVASNKQRGDALKHYWDDTLDLSTEQLDGFRAAVVGVEVVVPFDATATGVTDAFEAAKASGNALPLASGCQGGLSQAVLDRVNAVEGAFGLSQVATSAAGHASCTTRPIYGQLNLLNLRLPFPSSDDRASLPQQALVLRSSDSLTPRLTLHAGELLSSGSSALASSSSPLPSSSPATIERFGLLSTTTTSPIIDHVLLDYLNLLTPSTAILLVDYLLSSPTNPPDSSSELYKSTTGLTGVPTMEVQLWGGLKYEDVDFVRSGLSYPASSSASSISTSTSAALFFGSAPASALRSFALTAPPSPRDADGAAALARIEWTYNAEEEQIVVDSGVGVSAAFEKVWTSSSGTGKAVTREGAWKTLQGAGRGS
ncbi:hypothetical protein JCM11641_002278 [Rhodosporidiobolus odoratus]